MRVLLIAEACNPEWPSVPLVGFNFFNALRDVADITLVTHVRNQAALLRHPAPPEKVAFVDSDRLAAPAYRLAELLTLGRGLGWTTKQALMWGPYLYFEHLVWRRFGRALKAGEYDLVHRVTPLSPTYASPLASWTEVPFILGPLNGGLPWPRGATRTRLAELEFLSYFREAYRVLPYVRQTYQRAAAVLCGSRYTLSALPPAIRRKAVYLPENGIDPERFSAAGRRPPGRIHPPRILFAGRLVPYKGADVVLDAFASSPRLRSTAELFIVGDGPQRPALHAQTARLGIARHVCFTGRLPQADVVEHFRAASVFAFPSLREFGGGVVLEAMACGLPAVVLDHGGPAELITPQTGVALPVADRAARVSALRSALEDLLATPERLDAMSRACEARVAAEFTWLRKAQAIGRLYERSLALAAAAKTGCGTGASAN